MKLFFLSLFVAANALANPPQWSPELASKFIALSLDCVDQEYPNTYDRAYSKRTPSEMQPSFYGCYDWHSSVHGHWSMARVLRMFPDLPEKAGILEKLNSHFQADKILKEKAHFEEQPGFERPYGYAWFLRLMAELAEHKEAEARVWEKNLQPLENFIADASLAYFQKINRPVRDGHHYNTAFAMKHIYDYAERKHKGDLQEAIGKKARELFGLDKDCPLAYEPSAMDFLSPCFEEADLMRRVLPAKDFSAWFARFLPRLRSEGLRPVVPADKKDYLLGHLIGLMFSKATAMEAVAKRLPENDGRKKILERASKKQREKGIELMFDSGYGGTHWLASFAIYEFSGANEAR